MTTRRPGAPFAFLALIFAICLSSTAAGQRVFRATLDGTQETPSVTTTTATGTGSVVLNAAETQISLSLQFSGLTSNQVAGHIHSPAPRGSAAGVLIDIGSSGTTSGSFTLSNIAVSPAEVANLKNGLWYFNVHSASFGGGEIRGQIEPDCASLPAGLVSWWQGEGNALDQNALNNGTLQGSVLYAGGRTGRAFRLGGNGDTGNFGDRVIVGNPTNLQLQDFTIEAWIRRSSSSIVTNSPVGGVPGGTFFAYGQNGYGFLIDQATNGLALTRVGVDAVYSTATVTDTNFHHVAVTKSGNQVTFYVDGVAAGAPITYNTNFAFTSDAALGARGDADTRNAFFGDIDELSVFNRALTSSEIGSIANGGASGKCPPCIATPIGLADWWTGDGNVLGLRNRNNGTLSAGSTFAEGLAAHAFKFDRDDGGDSVIIPDSNSLDVTTQFTFDAWIKPESLHPGGVTQEGGVISKLGTSPSNYAYQFGITSGNTGIFCQFNAVGDTTWPNNILSATVPGGVPINQWSHIACSYDNDTMRAYYNGVMVGSSAVGPKTVLNSTAELRISGDGNSNVFFDGLIDEPEIINRALSQSEIVSIVMAGRSCKCKPTATSAPANLIAWYAGDSYATDLTGNNGGGTLQNGAGYAIGKVGQGFLFDGADDSFSAPQTTVINSSFTAEAWVNPATWSNSPVIYERGTDITNRIGLQIQSSGILSGYIDSGLFTVAGGSVPVNTFTHVAYVFDDAADRQFLYINGVQTATVVTGGVPSSNSGNLTIGTSPNAPGTNFAGRIDEMSIYNRALSPTELNSIVSAGLAGKLKQASTSFNPPAVAKSAETEKGETPTSTTVGDATVNFPDGIGVGVTQWVPVPPADLPRLPFQSQDLTYDISTTASFFGPPTVCFNLPSFTTTQFANLQILHLENSNWINRTAAMNTYPNLCTTGLTSLSPFAIVNNLAPTAASVTVGGKVLTAHGLGVSNATVRMTDSHGSVRRVRTSSLGYFSFDSVLAGETYIVTIGHKRYTFQPRVVNVVDEVTDLEIVATP